MQGARKVAALVWSILCFCYGPPSPIHSAFSSGMGGKPKDSGPQNSRNRSNDIVRRDYLHDRAGPILLGAGIGLSVVNRMSKQLTTAPLQFESSVIDFCVSTQGIAEWARSTLPRASALGKRVTMPLSALEGAAQTAKLPSRYRSCDCPV